MHLSNGDYVDLIAIESVLNKSQLIDGCFVTGAPYEEEFLTAVIVPNLERAQQLDLNFSFNRLEDLVEKEHVQKAVKKEIVSI